MRFSEYMPIALPLPWQRVGYRPRVGARNGREFRRTRSCHERRPRPWDCRDLTIMLACARAVVGACTA